MYTPRREASTPAKAKVWFVAGSAMYSLALLVKPPWASDVGRGRGAAVEVNLVEDPQAQGRVAVDIPEPERQAAP